MTLSNKGKWIYYAKPSVAIALVAIVYKLLSNYNTENLSYTDQSVPPEVGRHYVLIASSDIIPKAKPQTVVPIVEFFDYSCHVCHEIEAVVQAWRTIQSRAIQFEQIPIGSTNNIVRLHYLAHRLQNNMVATLFQWLAEGRNLKREDVIKNSFAEIGITVEDYEHAAHSQSGLDMQTIRGKKLEKLYEIDETPVFIIGSRYKTSLKMAEGNLPQLFRTIDTLIEKVRKGEA